MIVLKQNLTEKVLALKYLVGMVIMMRLHIFILKMLNFYMIMKTNTLDWLYVKCLMIKYAGM